MNTVRPSSRGAAAHVTARARVAALAKRIALPSAAAALALACLPAAANRALSQTDARQSAASAAPAPPQTPPARSPTPQPLNEQERRGQAIYVGGESASGPEVTAAVGQIDVPAEMLSCAGCHGRRGEGKTEGGVAAGALAWTHLTKPSGHTHPTGRKHGPFDESSFAKAITSGTDSSGNQLLTAMPRYRMTAEQMADLVSYLKRIEGDRDPRVTDTTLAVGMLVPARGALAETGQTARSATAAYFAGVNKQGGLHGRQIELKVAERGDTPAATAANLECLIADGQIFALVNVFAAGVDREVIAVASRRGVPVVGAMTLLTETGTPPARKVFFLMPGVDAQARASATSVARKLSAKEAATAVVHPRGNELAEAAARAFADQARRAGRAAPALVAYERGKFGAAAVAAELKRAGAQAVIFVGAGDELKLMAELEQLGHLPHVLLLGALAGGDVLSAPAVFKDRVFVAFPSVPADITPEGMSFLPRARARALARE